MRNPAPWFNCIDHMVLSKTRLYMRHRDSWNSEGKLLDPDMDLTDAGRSQLLEFEPTQSDPVFDRVVNAITLESPVSYAKINHAFWERLVFLDRMGVSYRETDPVKAREIDQLQGLIGRPPLAFVETGFVGELLDLLSSVPTEDTSFLFGAGLQGLPASDRLQGIPFEDATRCKEKIQQYVPASRYFGDGLEFKRSLVTGRFTEIASLLKERSFLLVANKDLARFPEFVGAGPCKILEIHGAAARYDRESILSSIRQVTEANPSISIVILQCGGALSTWLTIRLRAYRADLSVLDIGNALCICNPAAIFGRIYGKLFRSQILATMERIHPGWFEANAAIAAEYGDEQQIDATLCQVGRTGSLVDRATVKGVRAPMPTTVDPVPTQRPVEFIENKPADHRRIADLMQLSRRKNKFANFGPVATLLEDGLGALMNLPDDRVVVACCSGSIGLQIAAGLAAMTLGHNPSWLGSAFAFFSAETGLYSDAKLLDCTPDGALNLELMRQQPNAAWDAAIFTNTFSTCTAEWAQMRQHCRDHGKFLVVDNALGLRDRPNTAALETEVEVVSLHHTKPWGFGEGGAIVVPKSLEARTRSLLNFGVGDSDTLPRFATNGKLSDLAAAAIIDRLERMGHWQVFYQSQAHRLRKTIQKSGLPLTELNAGRRRNTPSGNLQYLAEFPLPSSALENDRFVLRKYYRPLGGETSEAHQAFPVAHDLYRRIINIPCHPFVRNLSSDEIIGVLRRALEIAQE